MAIRRPLILLSGTESELAYGDLIDPTSLSAGMLFTATADALAGGNTSATSLIGPGVGSATLAVNALTVGRTLYVKGMGVLSTAATTGTTTVRLLLGSVIVSATTALSPTASLSGVGFIFSLALTCRTVTTNMSGLIVLGTVSGGGLFTIGNGLVVASLVPATVSVDTTTALAVGITAQNSVAGGVSYTTRLTYLNATS
jgi:hypothetical protein